MKISYADATGLLKEITLEPEDVKVLKTEMASIENWHVNVISNKLRRVRDALLKKILENPTAYLDPEDLAEIKDELDTAGIVFPRASSLTDDIKKKIIKLANIPTPPTIRSAPSVP